MNTYIKLHTLTVKQCNTPQEAQHWIDSNTLGTGYIKVKYAGSWNDVLPSELSIMDEHDNEHTHEHNNLSSHPRCVTCGVTTYNVLIGAHDHWIGQYTCGHHTMGFMHTGTKVEHCLYCAGSDHASDDSTCVYCKGIWS